MIVFLISIWLVITVLSIVAIGWAAIFVGIFLGIVILPFIGWLSDKPRQKPRHINNAHHDAGFEDRPDSNYPPFYPPYGADDYPVLMPPNYSPTDFWQNAYVQQQRMRKRRKEND